MTVLDERAQLLPFTHLASGGHSDYETGVCLLEAVAYVAGEEHTDHPECASAILGAFGRSLNDVLPDDKRQRLVPLVPAIVGTAGDGHDQERGLMAADWLIRVYTPTWLRLAGLEAEALELETLPVQATWDDVEAAVPVVRGAQKAAYARRVAAGAAARAAARDAAGAAAWAAAGAAAWAAAGAAARDAAGAAARDAARDAAGDAARDAARAAARAAAGDAAGDAAGAAAWAAARAAAREHLQPTVDALQDSAIDLFTSMVHVADAHD